MLTPRNGDFTSAQVKRLRELLGLSQRVVASRFGVSLNTWSRWEIGTINVHRVRVAGFRQLLAKLEKQRVDQEERQPRARSENPDTRSDQSIFISVRVSEDIYRVQLDKTAAVFHDLESTQLGSDLERSELLAELTGLIQKLDCHARHSA